MHGEVDQINCFFFFFCYQTERNLIGSTHHPSCVVADAWKSSKLEHLVLSLFDTNQKAGVECVRSSFFFVRLSLIVNEN